MEFFEWLSSAQLVIDLFTMSQINADTLEEAIMIIRNQLLLCLGIAAGVFVLCLVLGGFGLMKMAKREGKKHVWMAFVPILNTWYAGHIAGEARFFGQKMKRAGLYAAIAEGLYCILTAVRYISTFLFLPYSKIELDTSYSEEGIQYIVTDPQRLPGSLRWLYDFDLGFQILGYVLNLIMIVFLCVVFIALFKKYYARSPILMTFFCAILPFRAFVLFAVRNNKPVDYDAYMRRRMEEAARRSSPYGSYGPYNSGPYNNGPYNNGPYNGQGGYAPPRQADDPFSDFGSGQNGNGGQQQGGDDNPFSDF